MELNKIIEADIKMSEYRFEVEKKERAYRKKKFIFEKSYENFDLYRHKTARIF